MHYREVAKGGHSLLFLKAEILSNTLNFQNDQERGCADLVCQIKESLQLQSYSLCLSTSHHMEATHTAPGISQHGGGFAGRTNQPLAPPQWFNKTQIRVRS